MGFWSKLGKIALVAAPYVAAPFTGGASLYFTGATNAALKKWNEHDAKKAAEKGMAPSKFDKYLGYGADAAGMASGAGAFGKYGAAHYAGSGAGGGAQQLSGWQNRLKQAGQVSSGMSGQPSLAGNTGATDWKQTAAMAGAGMIADYMRNQSNQPAPPNTGVSSFQQNLAVPRNGAMPRGGFDYQSDPLNQYNQSNPNLAMSIFQGRQEAMRSQPFRSGYISRALDRDDQVIETPMPPIYPHPEEEQRLWN